jgi:adenylosuccinate lyase
MRQEGAGNRLLDRLAEDGRFPLGREELDALLADRITFTGAAADQVAAVVGRIDAIVAAHPEAAAYSPGSIL